jgi:hypothetical protein
MDISGSPGADPNARSLGDTACPRFRSSEEMRREAASEFPLPIVRAAERRMAVKMLSLSSIPGRAGRGVQAVRPN